MTESNKLPPPARVVRCPRCRKSVRYDDTNPYRPFCSPRCKDEDIISWAQESFRIAGEETEDPGELPTEPIGQKDEED